MLAGLMGTELAGKQKAWLEKIFPLLAFSCGRHDGHLSTIGMAGIEMFLKLELGIGPCGNGL